MITSALFNPLGDWIALACQNLGQLVVWEWQSQTYVLKQQGHFNNMDTTRPIHRMACTLPVEVTMEKVSDCFSRYLWHEKSFLSRALIDGISMENWVFDWSRSNYGTHRMVSVLSRSPNIHQQWRVSSSRLMGNSLSRVLSMVLFVPMIFFGNILSILSISNPQWSFQLSKLPYLHISDARSILMRGIGYSGWGCLCRWFWYIQHLRMVYQNRQIARCKIDVQSKQVEISLSFSIV